MNLLSSKKEERKSTTEELAAEFITALEICKYFDVHLRDLLIKLGQKSDEFQI